MSINLELYNRCNKCKHLKMSLYMTVEDGEDLYNHWCAFNYPIGEVKCNKFEDKE